MYILPSDKLIKTGKYDKAEWNYRKLLGYIQRLRFRLAISFLSRQQFSRLLEIGYGSGIFLPELAKYSENLYGIDIHDKHLQVRAMLKELNISADLYSANVLDLPFDDNFFDCIIAVSTLEFIDDIDTACKEIKRVLKKDGAFIVVPPGRSLLADISLMILTGEHAKDSFDNRRQQLIPMLLDNFVLRKKRTIPSLGSFFIHIYSALLLSKDSNSHHEL